MSFKFKIFNSEKHVDEAASAAQNKATKRLSVNLTKASSTNNFLPSHAAATMSTLAKSSSYSSYPSPHTMKGFKYNGNNVVETGSQKFQNQKGRTLRRRQSIDFSDILKRYDDENNKPLLTARGSHRLASRRPSEEMRRRMKRTRSLPCLSSWDIYGGDDHEVHFNKRMSSHAHIGVHLRAIAPGSPEPKVVREKIRKEDAIYEVVGDKLPVVAATKEKILKLLIDPKTENEYVHQFLETHIWHTNPCDLFAKLVELYNPNMSSPDLATTRQRVIGVIIHWLDHFPQDFSSQMKDALINFIDVVTRTAMPAKELLDAVGGGRRASVEAATCAIKSSKIPKKQSGESGKFQFLDFHPTEVARQITLVEQTKFCEIPRKEFLRQSWNKTDGETRAPKLVGYIKRFNQISYWVATEIVFTPNLKQRTTVVKKMIQIASKCVGFNNFNTAMEIVAGLNLSSVQRLKKTWKGLASKYTGLLEDITKLLSAENNYRQYRAVLNKGELPGNPYLGVFLRDLTFIEDGNSDFVEDDQFLNFEKLRMVSGVLSTISKYQRVTYNFEVVPVIRDYLNEAMFLDDAALYKYSQLCEASAGATAVAQGMTTGTGFLPKSKRSSLGIFTY